MPTYDYRCTKGHRFELFHSIKDDSPKRCPRCKSKAVRVPSAGAGILFKGSGFYITDYRSSSYKEKAKQETGGGAKPEGAGKTADGGPKPPAGGPKPPGGGPKSPGGGPKPAGGKASGGSGGSKGGARASDA